jgi:Tol biopolymer transport system component
MLRIIRSVGITAVTLAAATPGPAVAQRVSDLQVIPESVSITVGERKEVMAVAYGSGGDVMTQVTFAWSTSDDAVVQVETEPANPGGAYLIGTGPGSARITVRVGNIEKLISVEATGNPIAGPVGEGAATLLRLEPQMLYLFPLEDFQLRPIFLKDDGSLAAYSPVTWRSFRPDVATVEQDGRVIGVTQGPGVIEATTASGLTARIQVQVGTSEWAFSVPVFALSPLQSDTVRVVVPEQDGRPLANRWLTWRAANPNVVTVSPLGVVTAISAGQTEVAVTGFGQEMRLPVRVHREVESFLISPTNRDTVVVPLGGLRRIEALPEAADETVIPDAPVNWFVGDTTLLTYSVQDTTARGRAIGHTTLAARAAGGMEVIWNVRIVAAGLALDPDRFGMSLDDEVTLEAFFADSAGEPLSPATDVSWSSTNEGVVRVTAAGRLTPISRGRGQIVASTPWGVADTALVFVQGEILITSTRNGSADLFALDRDDPGALTQITDDLANEIGGVYSPDGSQIAFSSDREGNFELYVVDADGGNARRLTETTSNEAEPAWTPDGRQIVYQTDAAGATQVWIMDRNGANQRALTMGATANLEPTVSPDGSRIAFTSVRDGNYEIYLMNLDGSNQQNATRSAESKETSPAWLDDGTIVFLREHREGRQSTWVVVKYDLIGETEVLTDSTMVVTDFAISPADGLLAVTTQGVNETGAEVRQLLIMPIGGGTAVEVPRSGRMDRLVRPAFRP